MMEVKEEEEDRISALLDSVILNILMCLPYTQTQCAITTLTLSKRWLRFWTDLFNIKYHNPNSSIWPSAFPGFEYVAETLVQCRQSNLTKIQLSGDYKILFQSHVNNWIRYAVNCNVKDIYINFNNSEYVLEEFFFTNSCFTRLNLSGCVFNPTGAIIWKKLKWLSISFVYIDEDMVINILSGCPVLETFVLQYCNGYTLLDITSKSVKKLVINGYGNPEADEYPDIVKINAPYVSSLTIGGCLLLWKLLLLNVSSLIKANLNFIKCENCVTIDEEMFGLIISLLHAKELSIGILCNEVFSRLEATGFTFPSNLRVTDSQDLANSSDDSDGDSDGDSVESDDWKCFYMRERNESSLAGRITVKLLQDRLKFEDRISALPDGLLIKILSHLPDTKYAIRTGSLSKRWQHLWTCVPNLIFYPNYKNDSSSDLFSFADKALTQCRQLKLYKFELHNSRDYDSQFESQVNNCIRYAIHCRVEEFYLNITNRYMEAEYVLDQCIFDNSCITDLTLVGCIIKPKGAISWKKLKNLRIQFGILDEDSIGNILSGSPLLETLELCYSYGYKLLDISSKSVKNLIFSNYHNSEGRYDIPEIIKINAPNILSLGIYGEMILFKILLLNVSSLVKAHLDYKQEIESDTTQEEMLKGLILNLQHVKELKIGISCFKAFYLLEAAGFVFPSNFKVLNSLDDIAYWSDESYLDDVTVSDDDSVGDGGGDNDGGDDGDGGGDGDSDNGGGDDGDGDGHRYVNPFVNGAWKVVRLDK